MILYILYRIGLFFALVMPLKISYKFASLSADIFSSISKNDLEAVISNLSIVLNVPAEDSRLNLIARNVFRNFAKYLVDFFRFEKIDAEYIKKSVRIEGLENLRKGLSMGKGVIALSAHIGNWELGGAIISMSGFPVHAVVLPHKNKRINDFFRAQRQAGNFNPIELGPSLKACYKVLKNNGVLALLGDRDFSKNGLKIEFFGRESLMPRGPAVLSHRLGSAIVPIFITREDDNKYRIIIEEPILPDTFLDEETSVRQLTKKGLDAIESCIKKYPDQWFVFRKMWN